MNDNDGRGRVNISLGFAKAEIEGPTKWVGRILMTIVLTLCILGWWFTLT